MLYLGVLDSNYYICSLGAEMLKFGAKNDISLNLGPIILSYCHIWNQQPRICLTTKPFEKMIISKFGTKVPYLGILGLQS